MVLVKILKRRDAASVLVAIVVGFLLVQPLSSETAQLAGKISGLHNGQYPGYTFPGAGWKGEYLYPVVQLILELLILEILARLYVWLAGSMKK
jgi:hypothetical protein